MGVNVVEEWNFRDGYFIIKYKQHILHVSPNHIERVKYKSHTIMYKERRDDIFCSAFFLTIFLTIVLCTHPDPLAWQRFVFAAIGFVILTLIVRTSRKEAKAEPSIESIWLNSEYKFTEDFPRVLQAIHMAKETYDQERENEKAKFLAERARLEQLLKQDMCEPIVMGENHP